MRTREPVNAIGIANCFAGGKYLFLQKRNTGSCGATWPSAIAF